MTTKRCASWRRAGSLVATLLVAVLALAGARSARAVELIPSVGVTKSARNSNEQARVYGGLALRGTFIPLLKSEIGVAYRKERLAGDLDVTMWPVTASLWLTPIPTLYLGGGVGWYHTTLDYEPTPETLMQRPYPPHETLQEFGMHVGGGLTVPLSGAVALDLNSRYVFMDSQQTQLPPDYWSTTLGLAIRF